MYKHVTRALHIFLLVVFLGTCSSAFYFINAESDGMSATTAADKPLPDIAPTVDTAPEAGWSLIQPGLERRVISVYNEQSQQVESVHIWRLDQNYFQLDVAFDSTPKSLDTWQRETNALMVVNGGYYSIENERYFPNGLTIVNGEASGRSFDGFGGMLAINESEAELRWLVQKPYQAYERLQAALQSFPILVRPGGELAGDGEVAFARKILDAMPDGAGAVMIDGKMQDDATWKQAKVLLDLARMVAAKDPVVAARYGL